MTLKQLSVADRPKRFKVKPVVNRTGIVPLEFKVLVRVKQAEDTIVTKSGLKLFKPIETKEQEQASTMDGEIVDISPLAFTYETWPEGFQIPEIGEQVIFARFAGAVVMGDDGSEMRLMNDKDILAVRRPA